MRVRASGPYADALRELGAQIEEMSQANVYQALDSGLVTCNQNFYYAMLAYRQYEVAPYVLELDWGQNMSFGMFMNKFAFDRLSKEQQTALLKLGDDFIDHFAKAMIQASETDKAKMQAGIDGAALKKITPLAPEERERLLEAGQRQVAEWVAEASSEGIDGKAVLAAYQQLIDKYTRQRDQEGYPWRQ
jgi:TRAP-type C4-dicarboxylate transport system substrate-binding protein